MSFNDFVIVTVKGNYYRTNFWFTTKSEAVDRLENADLGEKSRLLRLWEKNNCLLLWYKIINNRLWLINKGIMKKTKNGYKKHFVIATGDYLKNKKIRKDNNRGIDTGICLNKTSRN